MPSSWLWLLALSGTLVAADWSCEVRGWVRAPDLEPNQRATGDARIVANGTDCVDIVSWGVALGFKERAVVKLPAAGASIPTRPIFNETEQTAWWSSNTSQPRFDWNDIVKAGHESPFADREQSPYDLARQAYDSAMANESLWQIKSAERIVFESELWLAKFADDERKSVHKDTQSFGIAVPSSNTDDSDRRWPNPDDIESTSAETSLYYNIIAKLKNGTRIEAPAGFTSFLPVSQIQYNVHPDRIVSVQLNKTDDLFNPYTDFVCDKKDVPGFEVTMQLPNAGHFVQGDKGSLSITVKMLNASSQDRPSHVAIYFDTSVRYSWAASFAADKEQKERLSYPDTSHRRHFGDSSSHKAQRRAVLPKTKEEEEENAENGFGSSHSSWGSRWPNATALSGYESETVLVAYEVPSGLLPTSQATFVDFVPHIHIQVETQAPHDHTATKEDQEEDEWRTHPEYFGLPRKSRKYSEGRLSVEVAVATSTDSPFIHYLSPDCQAPLLVDPSVLTKDNLPFKKVSMQLRAEDAENSRRQQAYDRIDYMSFRSHGGRLNNVGTVYLRYERIQNDRLKMTASPRIVMQA